MSVYPNQIMSIKRQTMVLSVEAFYATPTLEGETPDDPMETPGYSRCLMTIIDKSKKPNIAPIANIPENDISYIKTVSDIALAHKFAPKTNTNNVDDAAIKAANKEAFTMRMKIGDHKGKTAIEVLTEDASQKENLRKHQDHLRKQDVSFAEYNNKVIKGIDQAIVLSESGQLKSVKTEEPEPSITIYSSEYKFLKSRKDKEGRCLVYGLSLVCDLSRKYPFIITIDNGYAYVKTTATGGANIDMPGMVGKIRSTMYLTDVEFMALVNKMYNTMRDFQTTHFKKRYELKEKLDRQNREKAKSIS